MFTQHPTLLIGSSDWDETHAPKAEFDRRIEALWNAFPNASQAIVFGSASRHAELAYLTHFIPKLEPGIALLARDGQHKLLFGGGPNMIGAMLPLTFIADMAPLNSLTKLIAGWNVPLLIGSGQMSRALRETIDDATDNTATEATPHVRSLMRRKSAAELNAIRTSCGVLQDAIAALDLSFSKGLSTLASILACERAAIDAGAQDVRTLFSRDGGLTLRPFQLTDDERVDPLQVYVAVRKHNYWAEGFACVSREPQPATAMANLLLDNALSAVGSAVTFGQLGKITAVSQPYRTHPVVEGALVTAMGLDLEEPSDGPQQFEAGGVYSVRVGLTDHNDQHAIVSAMIAVRGDGTELLWRSGIACSQTTP